MIESAAHNACRRFQMVAARWLRSGELTRTRHLLSPLEELAGFNYGFIYLLRVDADTVKIGYSEHPVRRMRELQPAYRQHLRLQACFVGDPPAERFAHRRFASLRLKNELFYAHPLIETYFTSSRERMREHLRSIHLCSHECAQLDPALDLRMLQSWLSRGR